MSTRKTLMTADALLRLSVPGRRHELVKGELLEMPPAGGLHGSVAMRVGISLGAYVRDNDLGETFAAETGFILSRNPDTVRAPDASFVSKDRLPIGDLPGGYIDLAPDLAVEVVSPNDREGEVLSKAEAWLQAGTRLVWVIDPATRSATVYKAPGELDHLSENDRLDGGEVVPGFSCNLKDLWN